MSLLLSCLLIHIIPPLSKIQSHHLKILFHHTTADHASEDCAAEHKLDK